MTKKIGILTWHHYHNFGSRLQAYALYKYLSNLSLYVQLINYRDMKLNLIIWIIYIILGILIKFPYFICKGVKKDVLYASLKFERNYLPQTGLLCTSRSLSKHSKRYDSIICGSDQIWAPNVYNPIYMLDFVPDNVNKVSYAASIGLESIPDNLVDDYKKYIGRLNHISVREERGKEILKSQCSIDAIVVLDPTLLLPKVEWDKIKKQSKIKEKYIFCYFLKKDHKYKKLVKEFAEENGYEIYGISDKNDDSLWMHIYDFKTVGPCEFIGLIEGAVGVFTDSYHGTIFSMLYHKPFTLFERFSCGDNINQNSRIEQLKSYFGIDNNVVKADSVSSVVLNSINYEEFEHTLEELRGYSAAFLKKALS